MWVDYDKRKPPDNDTYILCWNYKLKRAILTTGLLLNAQQRQLQTKSIVMKHLEDDKFMHRSGYFVNKWMHIHEPIEK